jgi:hypothetical protein
LLGGDRVKVGISPLRFRDPEEERIAMKKTQKKISLSRETLHNLDTSALQRAGGASNTECSNPATCEWNSCPFTCSDRLC